jgi:transcriptional regulator with XRE-family HTH domain
MEFSFSEWLAGHMLKAGINQSELAKRAGVNQTVISRLLSGKAKPSPDTLRSLARVFRLPLNQVYEAAGLLRSDSKINKTIEQIDSMAADLPPEDQQDILEYIKLRIRIAEERERNKNVERRAKPRSADTG